MPLLTTAGLTLLGAVVAGTGVAATAAGVGYTIASGEDAKRKQADALGKQERAQQQAVNAAQGQRKQSEMVVNQANRQQPDVAGIMQAASAASSGGAGTMLTGPTGVDPNSLALGKSSLLGS